MPGLDSRGVGSTALGKVTARSNPTLGGLPTRPTPPVGWDPTSLDLANLRPRKLLKRLALLAKGQLGDFVPIVALDAHELPRFGTPRIYCPSPTEQGQ